MTDERLRRALSDLELALDAYAECPKGDKGRLAFLSVSKAYEVALEYTWKLLKRAVVDEGLDPQSPKSAIRDAGRIGLIDSVEEWLEFIDARNAGVHDYFSLPPADYVEIATRFLKSVSKTAMVFKNTQNQL